jgi:hypothetical protein
MNEQASEQRKAPEYHDAIFDTSWESFRDSVVPEDAGRYQRAAMCQAFIGGALAYRVCMSAAFGAPDTGDQDAIQRLKMQWRINLSMVWMRWLRRVMQLR